MTILLIVLTICIALLTANAFLTHKKLTKLQDELDRERCFRHNLEEIYMNLYEDYKEHMHKYH